MQRFGTFIAALFAVVLFASGIVVNAQNSRKNIKDVSDILRSLRSKVMEFESHLDYQLKSSSADQQEIGDVMQDIQTLKSNLSNFQTDFDQRRDSSEDISNVIDAAAAVNSFLGQNPQNGRISSDWGQVRQLIDRLSSNYGIMPEWDDSVTADSSGSKNYSDNSGGSMSQPSTPASFGTNSVLTGTYRLDPSRSEKTDQIIADSGVAAANRADLAQKLEAPQEIAIQVDGNRVVLATSKSQQPVTLIADGREKTDTDATGNSARMRATLKGDDLTVSSLGGDNDFTVTFSSQDNGRTLKVTRRITTDYLSQTVFADSIYTKTDNNAGLGVSAAAANAPEDNSSVADDDNTGGTYSSNDPNDKPGRNGGVPAISTTTRTGNFVVPAGTIITGQLESTIDTKASQNNDRFKLTVTSPNEYKDAVIDGHISNVSRSGRVSGDSNVTFNFDTITLPDGKKYDFAGNLQSLQDQNGKTVKIDGEGTARGGSQTKETVKRGGIGAGVGAVIGAIIGGGQGAAVGAIIGGGAGAGSVAIQGRDDLELMKGSTMIIQSSSPNTVQQSPDNE